MWRDLGSLQQCLSVLWGQLWCLLRRHVLLPSPCSFVPVQISGCSEHDAWLSLGAFSASFFASTWSSALQKVEDTLCFTIIFVSLCYVKLAPGFIDADPLIRLKWFRRFFSFAKSLLWWSSTLHNLFWRSKLSRTCSIMSYTVMKTPFSALSIAHGTAWWAPRQ